MELIGALLNMVVLLGIYPSYQSFVIENKDVRWVHVYEYDTTASLLEPKIIAEMKSHAWIRDVQKDGDDITADLVNYKIDYQKYGGTFFRTSNIIRTGLWNGRIKISVKNGKYRVIVYGLHYLAVLPKQTAGKMSHEAIPVSGTLTEWALTKYRDSFKKSRFENLDILHFNLKEIFTVVPDKVEDASW